ncbi:hypothetical protein Y1Q_0016523 [Alligator mississippiensis]|uniref:Uncharacterized protein n=1 Tax=Alligator mississippiensis TaxID=8496 RepID=A0A151N3J5_ALLMI|nr:hypothetical protein Y1Q_0016523 [Alligator mississippiensis]
MLMRSHWRPGSDTQAALRASASSPCILKSSSVLQQVRGYAEVRRTRLHRAEPEHSCLVGNFGRGGTLHSLSLLRHG